MAQVDAVGYGFVELKFSIAVSNPSGGIQSPPVKNEIMFFSDTLTCGSALTHNKNYYY